MSDTHAETAFIRTEMLGPQLPPVTERGVVKWLRENLFAGWTNTALTLVALFVVFWLVQMALPWWLNGVWNATSLGECRTIAGPEGGACWAVIKARWHQYIFWLLPAGHVLAPDRGFRADVRRAGARSLLRVAVRGAAGGCGGRADGAVAVGTGP